MLPGAALHGAALIGLAGAGCLAVWVRQRGRRTLGRPHPGVAWYAAALGCLMLALLAILAGLVWPAAYPALRLAHLHLNTLGFIGLSALGTLQVLMPTVLGVQDPDAVQRLRGQLPWALTAVALVNSADKVKNIRLKVHPRWQFTGKNDYYDLVAGLESFFAPKTEAEAWEKALREGRVFAEVAIGKSGNARLVRLIKADSSPTRDN